MSSAQRINMRLSSKSEGFIQTMNEIRQKLNCYYGQVFVCSCISDDLMDRVVDYFSPEFYMIRDFNKQVKTCLAAYRTIKHQIKQIDKLFVESIVSEEFEVLYQKFFEIIDELNIFYRNCNETIKTKDKLSEMYFGQI